MFPALTWLQLTLKYPELNVEVDQNFTGSDLKIPRTTFSIGIFSFVTPTVNVKNTKQGGVVSKLSSQ